MSTRGKDPLWGWGVQGVLGMWCTSERTRDVDQVPQRAQRTVFHQYLITRKNRKNLQVRLDNITAPAKTH